MRKVNLHQIIQIFLLFWLSIPGVAQTQVSDQFASAGLMAVRSIAADEDIPSRSRDGRWLVNRRTSEAIDTADAQARSKSELELVQQIRAFRQMKLAVSMKRGYIMNRLSQTAMPRERWNDFISEQIREDLKNLSDCNTQLENELRSRRLDRETRVACFIPERK